MRDVSEGNSRYLTVDFNPGAAPSLGVGLLQAKPSLSNLHFAIDEQLSVLMVRALSDGGSRAWGMRAAFVHR